jgi:hypothetical protein
MSKPEGPSGLRLRRRHVAVLASAAILTHGRSAGAAVNFSGKTLDLVVPAGLGSGADVYARALGHFICKYLPGQPSVQVRNLPGGGTITASNEFQQRARSDGLTIMSGSSSQVINSVIGDRRVRYDLRSWRPFVVSTQGLAIYAASSLGLRGPQDMPMLRDKRLIYGGASATAADLRLILSFEMLGWNTRNVWGIDRGQGRLAFERGEINLSYDATSLYKRSVVPLVERGMATPLLSFGVADADGNFSRDPNLPDLPNFQEAYKIMHGTEPSGIAYDAWLANFHMAMTLNKFFALPTNTPDEIFLAFTEATRKMLEDPEAARARELVLEGYPQMLGHPAEQLLRRTAVMEPAVLEWIDAWLKRREGVSLRPQQ